MNWSVLSSTQSKACRVGSARMPLLLRHVSERRCSPLEVRHPSPRSLPGLKTGMRLGCSEEEAHLT